MTRNSKSIVMIEGKITESSRSVLETTFEWEINIECFNGKKIGNCVESPVFSNNYSDDVLKDDWQLKLYPTAKASGYISLFLKHLNDTVVTAEYSLELISRNNEIIEYCKLKKEFNPLQKNSFGVAKFVEKSFIMDPENEVLKDNKLKILCKMYRENIVNVDVENIENERNESHCGKFDGFENLLTNEEFSDVTVTSNGKSFFLHKCILANSSNVFHAMFSNDISEKNQNTVEITDVRYEVLQEFFRFIYTGKVDKLMEMVCELLIAAEKYDIKALKELCEETMCAELSEQNAIRYLDLAISNNAEKLQENTINFISLHLEDFIDDPEYEILHEQHPKLSLRIMKKSYKKFKVSF